MAIQPDKPKKRRKRKTATQRATEQAFQNPLMVILLVLCFVHTYFIYILGFVVIIMLIAALCKPDEPPKSEEKKEAPKQIKQPEPEPAEQKPRPIIDISDANLNVVGIDYTDEILPAVVEICIRAGSASVSLIQRSAHIGYTRAARIIDEMENLGFIGPFQGSKPRELLITAEQWEAMKKPPVT